jgi:hypothetical protein
MAERAKTTDFSKLLNQGDLDVNVQLKTPEDDQEKALRLHKDQFSFYAKDLSVWILAPLIIMGAWCFCLWILISSGFSPVEKQQAWSFFTTITAGAIGVFFGKQIGK